MTLEPLRWGILGTGAIAAAFARDLAFSERGIVGAVGSRTQAAADRFADELGVQVRHATYEALVNDVDVDVVYVATPHPMHLNNAMLALGAGKPVLVEKPFAMTAAEAAAIAALAREQGLFAMEAMWTRFLPHMTVVRDWIADGALGKIVTVTADHGVWFAEDAESRLFAPALGGGALLDLGVYLVSLASMLLGEPNRMAVLSDPAFTGVDAQTSMILGYPSGAQAVLTCTMRADTPARAVIVGSDARIELDQDFCGPVGVTLVPRHGHPTRVESSHRGLGLHYQADAVARCLAGGQLESPVMPLDETISILSTMDAVRVQSRPA